MSPKHIFILMHVFSYGLASVFLSSLLYGAYMLWFLLGTFLVFEAQHKKMPTSIGGCAALVVFMNLWPVYLTWNFLRRKRN